MKVLSNSDLSTYDILVEADVLVNPDKKHLLGNLALLFDDANSMDKKLLSLVELQKNEY